MKVSTRSKNHYRKCRLCGSALLEPVYQPDHFLAKCKNCKLVFSIIEPTDDDLKEYYYDYPSYEELSHLTIQRYNEILDKLEKSRKTNNLLETGCGYGYFLEEAKKRNWNVYGTELSVKAIEKCKAKNIFVTDSLESLERMVPDKFDAIVSLEVVEHLKDPVSEAESYYKLLRDEGLLYFTTPNFNSFSRRLMGKKWNVIIFPEHLFYFTVRTLNLLMRKNNFIPLSFQTSGFSPARLIYTVRAQNSNDPAVLSYDYNEKDRQVRDSIEKNFLLRFIKNLINFVLTIFKSGDSLKMLYSKVPIPLKEPPETGQVYNPDFEIYNKTAIPHQKISVTIPSYNQGKYLAETIESVLEQDYPNLEIFVLDGGSTDNSVEVIRKYENRITAWKSEKDTGQSDAINKGFNQSSGDIISWLCSDDLYTKNALHRVNEIFSRVPGKVGVVHGNSEIFKGNQVIRYDKGYTKWTMERQLAGMAFPQPSSFIRQSCLKKVGMLNNALHYGMDYDLFARLSMICDFHYEDTFFSKYRLHGESKSTIAVAKFIDEWILIFNSIVDGLNHKELTQELTINNLKIPGDKQIINFYRTLEPVRSFNHEKLLFYFLTNVVRYDYASEQFSRVRRVGSYLKNKYSNYLKFEPDINRILKRSAAPPLLLLIARKFKRSLSKG